MSPVQLFDSSSVATPHNFEIDTTEKQASKIGSFFSKLPNVKDVYKGGGYGGVIVDIGFVAMVVGGVLMCTGVFFIPGMIILLAGVGLQSLVVHVCGSSRGENNPFVNSYAGYLSARLSAYFSKDEA